MAQADCGSTAEIPQRSVCTQCVWTSFKCPPIRVEGWSVKQRATPHKWWKGTHLSHLSLYCPPLLSLSSLSMSVSLHLLLSFLPVSLFSLLFFPCHSLSCSLSPGLLWWWFSSVLTFTNSRFWPVRSITFMFNSTACVSHQYSGRGTSISQMLIVIVTL